MVPWYGNTLFDLILRFVLLVNFIYYHILELISKYTTDHITPSRAKLTKCSASFMFPPESTQR